jgi:hypothetical protein
MKVTLVDGAPLLNTTPLATISIGSSAVNVMADDAAETRILFTFKPYQAVRVITADCFSPPANLSSLPRTLLEVEDSPWIKQLTEALERIDQNATFMQRARHFLFRLQDEYAEIVAWSVNWDART